MVNPKMENFDIENTSYLEELKKIENTASLEELKKLVTSYTQNPKIKFNQKIDDTKILIDQIFGKLAQLTSEKFTTDESLKSLFKDEIYKPIKLGATPNQDIIKNLISSKILDENKIEDAKKTQQENNNKLKKIAENSITSGSKEVDKASIDNRSFYVKYKQDSVVDIAKLTAGAQELNLRAGEAEIAGQINTIKIGENVVEFHEQLNEQGRKVRNYIDIQDDKSNNEVVEINLPTRKGTITVKLYIDEEQDPDKVQVTLSEEDKRKVNELGTNGIGRNCLFGGNSVFDAIQQGWFQRPKRSIDKNIQDEFLTASKQTIQNPYTESPSLSRTSSTDSLHTIDSLYPDQDTEQKPSSIPTSPFSRSSSNYNFGKKSGGFVGVEDLPDDIEPSSTSTSSIRRSASFSSPSNLSESDIDDNDKFRTSRPRSASSPSLFTVDSSSTATSLKRKASSTNDYLPEEKRPKFDTLSPDSRTSSTDSLHTIDSDQDTKQKPNPAPTSPSSRSSEDSLSSDVNEITERLKNLTLADTELEEERQSSTTSTSDSPSSFSSPSNPSENETDIESQGSKIFDKMSEDVQNLGVQGALNALPKENMKKVDDFFSTIDNQQEESIFNEKEPEFHSSELYNEIEKELEEERQSSTTSTSDSPSSFSSPNSSSENNKSIGNTSMQKEGGNDNQNKSNTQVFNPYKILNINENANPQEINNALQKFLHNYQQNRLEKDPKARQQLEQVKKAYYSLLPNRPKTENKKPRTFFIDDNYIDHLEDRYEHDEYHNDLEGFPGELTENFSKMLNKNNTNSNELNNSSQELDEEFSQDSTLKESNKKLEFNPKYYNLNPGITELAQKEENSVAEKLKEMHDKFFHLFFELNDRTIYDNPQEKHAHYKLILNNLSEQIIKNIKFIKNSAIENTNNFLLKTDQITQRLNNINSQYDNIESYLQTESINNLQEYAYTNAIQSARTPYESLLNNGIILLEEFSHTIKSELIDPILSKSNPTDSKMEIDTNLSDNVNKTVSPRPTNSQIYDQVATENYRQNQSQSLDQREENSTIVKEDNFTTKLKELYDKVSKLCENLLLTVNTDIISKLEQDNLIAQAEEVDSLQKQIDEGIDYIEENNLSQENNDNLLSDINKITERLNDIELRYNSIQANPNIQSTEDNYQSLRKNTIDLLKELSEAIETTIQENPNLGNEFISVGQKIAKEVDRLSNQPHKNETEIRAIQNDLKELSGIQKDLNLINTMIKNPNNINNATQGLKNTNIAFKKIYNNNEKRKADNIQATPQLQEELEKKLEITEKVLNATTELLDTTIQIHNNSHQPENTTNSPLYRLYQERLSEIANKDLVDIETTLENLSVNAENQHNTINIQNIEKLKEKFSNTKQKLEKIGNDISQEKETGTLAPDNSTEQLDRKILKTEKQSLENMLENTHQLITNIDAKINQLEKNYAPHKKAGYLSSTIASENRATNQNIRPSSLDYTSAKPNSALENKTTQYQSRIPTKVENRSISNNNTSSSPKQHINTSSSRIPVLSTRKIQPSDSNKISPNSSGYSSLSNSPSNSPENRSRSSSGYSSKLSSPSNDANIENAIKDLQEVKNLLERSESFRIDKKVGPNIKHTANELSQSLLKEKYTPTVHKSSRADIIKSIHNNKKSIQATLGRIPSGFYSKDITSENITDVKDITDSIKTRIDDKLIELNSNSSSKNNIDTFSITNNIKKLQGFIEKDLPTLKSNVQKLNSLKQELEKTNEVDNPKSTLDKPITVENSIKQQGKSK